MIPPLHGVRVVAAVCRRTWLKTLRRPVTLAFSLLQPVIWVVFFGFLFHRYDVGSTPGTSRYLDFLVPGVCAMTVLFGASQAGVDLIRDIESGFFQRLCATRASVVSILFGKVVADTVRLLGQALVLLVLGKILGAAVSLSISALGATALALGLFGAGFCSLSCLVALAARTHERMGTFVHLVNMPLLFTSSALVPARQMPDWLALAASVNPLTIAVDISRSALLGDHHSDSNFGIGILAALTAALFTASLAGTRMLTTRRWS